MSTFYTEVSHLQNLVDNIYNKENKRLENRKQGIDDNIRSQKRLIALNQSYTSKMKQYGLIIAIISFALVFTVMIITFKNLIPDIIANLALIIVIAGSLIKCYLIYVDIQNRDRLIFDELASDSSSLINTANINKSNADAGNIGDISQLAANSVGCIGKTCCPADWSGNTVVGSVYYNTKASKCCKKGGPTETEQPDTCPP